MKTYEYTVVGSGSFPMDMLRYDSSYPIRTKDCIEIVSTYLVNESKKSKIRLCHVGASGWKPTEERWESFGWKVEYE